METTIPCFDPFAIADSGQCFRMSRYDGGSVEALAGKRRIVIRPLGQQWFELSCTKEEYDAFWKQYFDLDMDYSAIETEAAALDDVLARAVKGCHGLRILRQEPWETLISFLISQRRSIASIKTCVERLCAAYGDEKRAGGVCYHAFPTPMQLAQADEMGLRDCGVGYRARYLLDAARRVLTGALPLDELAKLPNDGLQARLMEVLGVGVKVASCVMLFGYHRMDASPVDVWISRVIAESYGGVSPFERFGRFAGVYQQYLFYSKVGASAKL